VKAPSTKHQRRPGRASLDWVETGAGPGRPLAVTVAEAAELLDVTIAEATRVAGAVQPYTHADGSYRWPLRELARALADCGGVRSRW
jgi:hypothetical protein